MKRILVIGFVLLSLLALTGVVSAANTGKAEVLADVSPSLELGVFGGGFGWTLYPGDNTIQAVTVGVINQGYPGYDVKVADKLDSDNDQDQSCQNGGYPKPSASAGYMNLYKFPTPLNGCWGWMAGNLSTPLQIIGSTPITLSGVDQTLYTGSVSDSYNPTFNQPIISSDKPASTLGGTGYKIIITFTATPH